jgi:hypothetical protein
MNQDALATAMDASTTRGHTIQKPPEKTCNPRAFWMKRSSTRCQRNTP